MTKLLIYLTAIFLISCNDTEKEPGKSAYEIRWEKQEQLDSLNQNATVKLSKQVDAITNEDSSLNFTWQIQEIVKRNNKLISVVGYIKDIILNDSNYVLKIYGTFGRQKYFGEILITPEQFHELNKHLVPKSSHNQGCFIFQPTTIKSSSILTIDSEVTTDDNAQSVEEANTNASSELTYDFNEVLLFFKGKMTNIYLYKRLADDDD